MTTTADLFDLHELRKAVDEGYVRVQHHPSLPLTIFNYTEKATYEHAWSPVTRTCRGLIVNRDTQAIVARPFPKFFNHGEREAASLNFDEPVAVTDKEDGSLAILYPTGPGQYAIATRGSFTSEQAQHATKVWEERYASRWRPQPGLTYLFEIVYPANRIVLDYGGLDDLILLGWVDIATGRTYNPHRHAHTWPGLVVGAFPYASLTEALAAEPRPNAEGFVVHFLDSDQRVKVKYDWYVQQHRLLTGLTARRLWERCALHAVLAEQPDIPLKRLGQQLRLDPKDAQGIIDAGPDWLEEIRRTAAEEFVDWINTTVAAMHGQVAAIVALAEVQVSALRSLARRDAAASIAEHPHRGLIFSALDGKPITAQAWTAIYPAHERPFFARTEDVA